MNNNTKKSNNIAETGKKTGKRYHAMLSRPYWHSGISPCPASWHKLHELYKWHKYRDALRKNAQHLCQDAGHAERQGQSKRRRSRALPPPLPPYARCCTVCDLGTIVSNSSIKSATMTTHVWGIAHSACICFTVIFAGSARYTSFQRKRANARGPAGGGGGGRMFRGVSPTSSHGQSRKIRCWELCGVDVVGSKWGLERGVHGRDAPFSPALAMEFPELPGER
eukprot:gene10472-biopygen7768